MKASLKKAVLDILRVHGRLRAHEGDEIGLTATGFRNYTQTYLYEVVERKDEFPGSCGIDVVYGMQDNYLLDQNMFKLFDLWIEALCNRDDDDANASDFVGSFLLFSIANRPQAEWYEHFSKHPRFQKLMEGRNRNSGNIISLWGVHAITPRKRAAKK